MAVSVRKLLNVAGWSRRGLLGALGGRQMLCPACLLHQTPQGKHQRPMDKLSALVSWFTSPSPVLVCVHCSPGEVEGEESAF